NPLAQRQLLEEDCGITLALRFGRGAPASPHPVAVVEEKPVNDDVEKRDETALALVLAEYVVVVVDELELERRGEIVDVRRRHAVPATRRLDELLDERQIR